MRAGLVGPILVLSFHLTNSLRVLETLFSNYAMFRSLKSAYPSQFSLALVAMDFCTYVEKVQATPTRHYGSTYAKQVQVRLLSGQSVLRAEAPCSPRKHVPTWPEHSIRPVPTK
ncbi:hypothetical protein F4859DRAFT_482170 [Xylaria cf. heliscus]|nr:hypothetical protein F4859DRAFT_482170 [Xylaria cf. heliscus]